MKYHSSSNSSSTESFSTEAEELDFPFQGVEADMYLTDLMSPVLLTPLPSPPRVSMRAQKLLMSIHNGGESSNNPTENLVKGLPMSLREVPSQNFSDTHDEYDIEIMGYSEDEEEISSSCKSKLDMSLGEFPCKLVEGVMAV